MINILKKIFFRLINFDTKTKFVYYTKIAKNSHQVVFSKYKDIYKNRNVVLYACGPSAKFYSKIENAIHIGINRAFFDDKIDFDFLFMHDREVVLENLEQLKKYNAKKFCAFHINRYNADRYNTNSREIKYIEAEKFFLSDPWQRSLNDIYFDVINPNITDGLFFDRGGGTVFSALQFALYTHPKKIYLVGCDCTNNGYFYSNKKNSMGRQTNNNLLPKIIKLWKKVPVIMSNIYPDIEIISVNPIKLKGIFKYVYTQNFLKENLNVNLKDVNI